MTRVLRGEVFYFLQRVGGRFARRPARDVALWLACIPLVLPSPVVAASIAISARLKGDTDPRWWLILALSAGNFLLSVVAIVWISTFFGNWMIDRMHDFLGPFFFWPAGPSTRSFDV